MPEIDILLACDANESRPWFRDRIPGIKKAIDDGECSVEIVDIYEMLGKYKYAPTDTNVRKIFFQKVNFIEINKSFEKEVILRNPKILMLGTADNYIEFLIPSTLANIRREGISVVGILGDDEFNFPEYRFLLGWFDAFVAYVKPCLKYYESFNLSKGYYLPNSCYLDNKEFKEHSQKTEYDVILVGAPLANRANLMKDLIDSGLNVAIYGSKKWKDYDFASDCYFGFIPTEKFDEVLSKGKIVLAFLEDHLTGQLHMNTKIWEAVRVARLPLSTYYKRLEDDYGLVDGKDIVMYKNAKELVNKAIYYINHDDERIKVAHEIYNKVKVEFDYSVLYKKLFSDLMLEFSGEYRTNEFITKVDASLGIGEKYKDIKYFNSSHSLLDNEVLNHINIIKKISSPGKEIDYIYYDKVGGGRRIITRWPFISMDSVIFLSNKNNSLYYIYIFIRSYLLGRTLHIRQFCVVSEKTTLLDKVNIALDIMIHSKVAKGINNAFTSIRNRVKSFYIRKQSPHK